MKKKIATKNDKLTSKKNRGGIGSFYVIAIVVLMSIFGYMLIGESLPSESPTNPNGTPVVIQTPIPSPGQNNLQLYTFNGVTTTPVPTSEPQAPPASCNYNSENSEPQILIGSDPAPNMPAGSTGTIRVWVTDEGAPFISPGELLGPGGTITTPGNREALDIGTTGNGDYSWEPTIYVYPAGTTAFTCNAVNNACTAHYPDFILGTVNNNPPNGTRQGQAPVSSSPVDGDYVNFENNPQFNDGDALFGGGGLQAYISEYKWTVSDFKLAPGNYDAQYVIHDGDQQIGIGCVTISI